MHKLGKEARNHKGKAHSVAAMCDIVVALPVGYALAAAFLSLHYPHSPIWA